MENQTAVHASKSHFITAFAWLMIIFNGFGLLIALIQNILIAFIFRRDDFSSSFSMIEQMPGDFAMLILKNIRWIVPLFGLFVLFAFISSIGLLKRKGWARKAFIYLMVFGIIYTVAGTIFQIYFTRSLINSAEIHSDFDFFTAFIMVTMIIFSLGFIFLFGWLFKKLSSADIRNEFHTAPDIIE